MNPRSTTLVMRTGKLVSALVMSSRVGFAIGAHGVCAQAGRPVGRVSNREVTRLGLVAVRMRCSFRAAREGIAPPRIVLT